jgi:hypothetical protein
MGVVITYLLYLVASIGITIFVGLALSRSGRTFLLDIFGGNDSLAEAVNRLLVVGFYLLNLGFVTLTLRATGEITSARQAVQLLSVKIGEMLLVIGALHFANLVILTRLRRRPRQPVPPGAAGAAGTAGTAGTAGQAGSGVPRQPLAAGGHGKPLQ